MTNLLIGTCQIPLASTGFTTSTIGDANLPGTNLFGGSLVEIFRLASAVTGLTTMNFDVGSGVTKAANFLYIAKANMLQSSGVTEVALKGNSAFDYGSGTVALNDTSFASSTLVGPYGEDYLATFTTSTAFRFWFAGFTSTLATKRPIGKLYFGTSLDLGRDPISSSFRRVRPTDAQRKSRPVFTLGWEGISYTNTETLINTVIAPRRTNPVVLYTATYHGILNGYRALLCKVTEASVPRILTDQNEVQLTFETLI